MVEIVGLVLSCLPSFGVLWLVPTFDSYSRIDKCHLATNVKYVKSRMVCLKWFVSFDTLTNPLNN